MESSQYNETERIVAKAALFRLIKQSLDDDKNVKRIHQLMEYHQVSPDTITDVSRADKKLMGWLEDISQALGLERLFMVSGLSEVLDIDKRSKKRIADYMMILQKMETR